MSAAHVLIVLVLSIMQMIRKIGSLCDMIVATISQPNRLQTNIAGSTLNIRTPGCVGLLRLFWDNSDGIYMREMGPDGPCASIPRLLPESPALK